MNNEYECRYLFDDKPTNFCKSIKQFKAILLSPLDETPNIALSLMTDKQFAEMISKPTYY